MEENKLFVYGTLKSGHGNNRFLETAEKIGDAITVGKFGFYKNGIPYVTDDEEKVNVKGELYKVPPNVLDRCDMLEGHPSFYTRKLIKVRVGNTTHKAWCYINNNINKTRATFIEDGQY